MKQKQLGFWSEPAKSHGGALRLGKRKIARPLATKRPIHVVFKSSRAKGAWSLLRRREEVKRMAAKTALQFRVRVYFLENVGNHLHLGVQACRRSDLQNFLRVLPQAIAFLVTGVKKGNPQGKFWDLPVFTRVVEWGRDWAKLHRYREKNQLEGVGVRRELAERLVREGFVVLDAPG